MNPQDPNLQDFDMQRLMQSQNQTPTSNYETVEYLLKNSDVTQNIAEVEKEIKLSNLDDFEKTQLYSLSVSFQEQLMLKRMHLKKYIAHLLNYNNQQDVQDTIKQLVEEHQNDIYDDLNHLRRMFSYATISRGYKGFERNSLNTTISTNQITQQELQNQQKKSMFSKMLGGGFNN